jgi:hypothetical protein
LPPGEFTALYNPYDLTGASSNTADRVTVRIGTVAGVFARGLLSELLVSLGVWYEIAPRALASWPIHRASITDLPGLCFWIEPPIPGPRAGWHLTATVTVQPRRRRRRGLSASCSAR